MARDCLQDFGERVTTGAIRCHACDRILFATRTGTYPHHLNLRNRQPVWCIRSGRSAGVLVNGASTLRR